MVDGSGSRGCHIIARRGAERQANRHTGGLGTRDCPLRVGDIDGFVQRRGRSRLTVGAPGRGALGPAGSRMRALSIGSLPSGCLGENREDTVGNVDGNNVRRAQALRFKRRCRLRCRANGLPK